MPTEFGTMIGFWDIITWIYCVMIPGAVALVICSRGGIDQ